MDFNVHTLNKAIIAIKSRAERLDDRTIVDTFASVGALEAVISNEDHQVIFGRRGTGKTHALRFLSNKIANEDGVSFFIDMSSLGSDTSIYNDGNLSIAERSKRLLIDVLNSLSHSVIELATSAATPFTPSQLDKLMSILDNYNDCVSLVRVDGTISITRTKKEDQDRSLSVGSSLKNTGVDGHAKFERGAKLSDSTVETQEGIEIPNTRFPNLSSSVRELFDFFAGKRIWILLDEWSSIPVELQPILADMLRKTFFNIQSVTVKIAAIEHRTQLVYNTDSGEYIGLEPTADIKTNLKLDDYLLFDNDPKRSVEFFEEFLFKHVVGVCREKGWSEPKSPKELVRLGFSQKNAFEEFVKSTEGVPRDAINIASNSAQKAFGKSIDIPTIRTTAHRFFQEDKSSQVEENPLLRKLLEFIIDDAIRSKKTNSFLLKVNKPDKNVDMLFDRRLVHIRSRNVSSRDNPGERYFHYKLDYGCYIDLITTKQMPHEFNFLPNEANIEAIVSETVVPEDNDGRSYRRSILDLEKFYQKYSDL
jgi:hypothetical protein